VKKALVILLLVLYSASTIGATINMHYCMNKFAGYSFNSEKKDKCPKCGMKNMGCCKDEKKQIKLTADQQKAELNTEIHFQPVVLQTSFPFPQNVVNANPQKQSCQCTHAPSLIAYINAQAFFATFLI
jgi:hypothetical protein